MSGDNKRRSLQILGEHGFGDRTSIEFFLPTYLSTVNRQPSTVNRQPSKTLTE
ncbi:hypothetical protein [Calothrix sp. NIES-2100]|uniref:hypothetical protein n=1 Tax=Calothrix sp. NIES-2100 TaxID=1954172 RepID=UPI0030DD7AAF